MIDHVNQTPNDVCSTHVEYRLSTYITPVLIGWLYKTCRCLVRWTGDLCVDHVTLATLIELPTQPMWLTQSRGGGFYVDGQ